MATLDLDAVRVPRLVADLSFWQAKDQIALAGYLEDQHRSILANLNRNELESQTAGATREATADDATKAVPIHHLCGRGVYDWFSACLELRLDECHRALRWYAEPLQDPSAIVARARYDADQHVRAIELGRSGQKRTLPPTGYEHVRWVSAQNALEGRRVAISDAPACTQGSNHLAR